MTKRKKETPEIWAPRCEWCGGAGCRCAELAANKSGGPRKEIQLVCPVCGGETFHLRYVTIPDFYFQKSGTFTGPKNQCVACGWSTLPDDNGELRVLTDLALQVNFGTMSPDKLPRRWQFAQKEKEAE